MKDEVKCIIIAKKTKTLEEITHYLSKEESFKICPIIDSFSEFSKMIINKDVDVVFIETDNTDNQYLNFLNILSEKPLTIVLSHKVKIAAECYRLKIDDFLLKPLTDNRFEQCIQKIHLEITKRKILSTHKLETPDISKEPEVDYKSMKYIFINSYKCSVRININDIISIERIDNVTLFFMEKNESIPVQSRLSSILNMLPPQRFARINKGQIVNLDKVRFVKGNHITLYNQEFAISRNYIDVLRRIKNNMRQL